jgi:hypothetical protein
MTHVFTHVCTFLECRGSQHLRQDHGHRQGAEGRHVPHSQRHQEDPGLYDLIDKCHIQRSRLRITVFF